MSGAKILVVEHEADTGVGRVGEALRAAGAELTIVGPETGCDIPANLEGFAALIVLGGTPGPTDDDTAPWLPRARALVAEALETQTPYLGICLGAQILAVVAGGEVGEAAQPEVGLCNFELTLGADADPLLGGLEQETGQLRALQWHFLEILRLPPATVSLARSERCANQAFRVGPSAWGLQFHLEADATTARVWAKPDEVKPELEALGLRGTDIVSDVAENEDWLVSTWGGVARRWLDVVNG
ncbi:type 1 glutamine amidotransferase [Leucobacter insecticola]|uniref:Type 1 glutamine amidotransferase n=1 Tax=Leucobacter insecticola TaxID=2714934 RepID=A0A6G8FIR6_9MICO|nr:type 1 glutamine amidotransferase [Leucobacter insecticola]QIM16366.1 type 1 glutamine amidotransferase [Leucobacter insecticola]